MNRVLIRLFVLCFAVIGLQAENILFIGNSFTYGGDEAVVRDNGGVPKLVEAIAASKGKTGVLCLGLTAPAMGWQFHINNPATITTLESRKWDWVVLQDLSTKPTHLGNRTQFLETGKTLYSAIKSQSKESKILLFETWARGKGCPIYTGSSTATSFRGPYEMTDELEKGYSDLQGRLNTLNPGDHVALARVGTAFARIARDHPEINLYWSDHYHANREGSYFAALVIYGTLFNESPRGATREFPAFVIDAREADKLQAVAEEIVMENGLPDKKPRLR